MLYNPLQFFRHSVGGFFMDKMVAHKKNGKNGPNGPNGQNFSVLGLDFYGRDKYNRVYWSIF